MASPSCPRCGAPSDPSRGSCRYCGAPAGVGEPSAALDRDDWEVLLPRGELSWGPPLSVRCPASPNDLRVLRSLALVDDVDVVAAFAFVQGTGWKKGAVSTSVSLVLRASNAAGYEVSVSAAGLVSVGRYEDGRHAAWLLEPMVHPSVEGDFGTVHRLRARFVGNRLLVACNGRDVGAFRDDARRSGAVELALRPGDAEAALRVDVLSVRLADP